MKNYSGKKIAFLRGYPRMIDGETTSIEEMYQWGKENDVYIHSFHLHKPWKRKSPTYNDGYDHPYTAFNKDTVSEVLEEINENYDLVILINPAKLYVSLKSEDIQPFHQLYKDISVVKVQMQHNHLERSINNIPYLWSYLENSDWCMNLAEDSWFTKDIVKALPSKKDRYSTFSLWTGVSDFEDYYRNEDRLNNVTYIGRFAFYKNPQAILNLAEAFQARGIKPEIYGMDRSIGCRVQILDHPNTNNLVTRNNEHNTKRIVDVHGLIEHEEVLNTFNKSMFAISLLKLTKGTDGKAYGDKLEYIMQEAIKAGSILVVNKEWADNCRTKSGVRYSDIENFSVVIDDSAPAKGINLMKQISEDKELQATYRDTAFRVLKEQYDRNVVLDKIMTELFSIKKQPSKPLSDKELVLQLTNNSERIANSFEQYYQDGFLIPMTPRYLNSDTLCIFGGKSGRAVKRKI